MASTAASTVKISPAIKALIASSRARGAPLPMPPREVTRELFDRIRKGGEQGGVGKDTWLSLSTAVLFTCNSPDAVCELFTWATEGQKTPAKVEVAAIMRETGLKCISFNGIPKTINNLNALRGHLPNEVVQGLSKDPQRTPHSIDKLYKRGRQLWDGVYEPKAERLVSKLGSAHPDLPVHILNSHYGPLLSDPEGPAAVGAFRLGRVLTSVVAIAALRSQMGVGPQVTSHVFGLKKALLEGGGGDGRDIQGQDWLASDEGIAWILNSVDEASALLRGEAARL